MPSHRYPDLYGRPDLTWSGGLNRSIRRLRLIAIAGAIGAAGGGLGVLAIIGVGAESPPSDMRAAATKIPTNAAIYPVSSEPSQPKAAAPPPSLPAAPNVAAATSAPDPASSSSAMSVRAPTYAAQTNEPAVKHLYDRARIRARRRIARRPLSVLPRQQPAFGESRGDGGWRDGDWPGGSWRGGFLGGDDWRN
jgi:hypothetical protein